MRLVAWVLTALALGFGLLFALLAFRADDNLARGIASLALVPTMIFAGLGFTAWLIVLFRR